MSSSIQFGILLLLSAHAFSHECPINEHYTNCINDCPTPTCSDLTPANCQTFACNKGCECNEGYVRIKKPKGTCVPKAECKKCLRPDFFYNECPGCNNTCSSVLSGPTVCVAACFPKCTCRTGVYDERTDKCVAPEKCCPPNEHFSKCITNWRNRTCSNPFPEVCRSYICKKGCECDEGFIRTKNPDGVCVPLDHCRKCFRHDFKYDECGSKCFSTCSANLHIHYFCNDMCVPGCYCKDGVYDEEKDKCVAPERCTKVLS